MDFALFPSFSEIFLGLFGGLLFGFILQKAAVTKFNTIVGQFLLRDFTVMKVILTAVLVGSTGIYLANSIGLVPSFQLSETPVLLGLLGGATFGVGMSVLGYCPGTGIAALASGAKDVIWGFFGMIMGAIIFNALSPSIMPHLHSHDTLHKKTLADWLSVHPGLIIAALAAMWGAFYLLMKKFDAKKVEIKS